jgi:hypothetical protein
MKMIRLSTLALSLSLSLAIVGAVFAQEKPSASGGATKIEKTILCRKVEHIFEPAKSFKPNDTFALVVYLSEAKVGTRVRAVWTLVHAGRLENMKLLENKMELTEDAIKGVKEPNRFNFGLEHDAPYPPGDYKIEIYLNDELAKSVAFQVK